MGDQAPEFCACEAVVRGRMGEGDAGEVGSVYGELDVVGRGPMDGVGGGG